MSDTKKATLQRAQAIADARLTPLGARLAVEAAQTNALGQAPSVTTAGSANAILGVPIAAILIVVVALGVGVVAWRRLRK